ncbi:MAG: phosphopantetheine-binding protein [Chloroflexota bacterium]|nr:phosphopantetheine-binding protein [Chloroflexota bacterium]
MKPEGLTLDTWISDEDATGADSMSRIELTLALEDEFHVIIGDEDFEGLATVGDLVTLLERKTGTGATTP